MQTMQTRRRLLVALAAVSLAATLITGCSSGSKPSGENQIASGTTMHAANAITLSDDAVWMSRRAAESLTDAQRDTLAGWGFAIRTVPLDEIEKAGGSLRCCVGEIF